MKTHLNDLFDQLEPEKGNKLDDKIKVSNDERIEKLKNIFYENFFPITHSKKFLKYLSNKIDDIYSSKEIEQFSLQFDKLKSKSHYEYLGYFLSSLINESNDEEFKIHTKQLEGKINKLGIMIRNKKIQVNGDVGDNLGKNMENSKITVFGSAGELAGYDMKRSIIKIRDNVNSISIFDGEIYVEGEIKSVDKEIDYEHIYHRGRFLTIEDANRINEK